MNLPIIDTKAIAREQNALKRKYEKAWELINELPMLEDDNNAVGNAIQTAYSNQLKDLLSMALIQDAEFESDTVVTGNTITAEPVNLSEIDL